MKFEFKNNLHIRFLRIKFCQKIYFTRKKNQIFLTFFDPKINIQVPKSLLYHLLFDALSESKQVFAVAFKMAERIKHTHRDRQTHRQTIVNYSFQSQILNNKIYKKLKMCSYSKNKNLSRFLRNPGRAQDGHRGRPEKSLPQDGAAVSSGQEQGARRHRSLQNHWQGFRHSQR